MSPSTQVKWKKNRDIWILYTNKKLWGSTPKITQEALLEVFKRTIWDAGNQIHLGFLNPLRLATGIYYSSPKMLNFNWLYQVCSCCTFWGPLAPNISHLGDIPPTNGDLPQCPFSLCDSCISSTHQDLSSGSRLTRIPRAKPSHRLLGLGSRTSIEWQNYTCWACVLPLSEPDS